MTIDELTATGRELAVRGRVFVSADERPATVDRRVGRLGLEPGPEARRAYREALFTAPCLPGAVSGIVVDEEVLSQAAGDGTAFPDLLSGRGLLWGVRMDTALTRLAGCPGETVTEGLGGLGSRLTFARFLGARFARWRAVFAVGDGRPSPEAVTANARSVARFAALCQVQGLVPVMSVRMLRVGHHDLERCGTAGKEVLRAIVTELADHGVDLSGVVFGTSMVLPGTAAPSMASVDEVAAATRLCLLSTVPEAVPAIVLSTTGQSATAAAAHLNAVVAEGELPWRLVLSSGPTLQEEVLRAWCGRPGGSLDAHQALAHRLACHQAAARGDWSPELEDMCVDLRPRPAPALAPAPG